MESRLIAESGSGIPAPGYSTGQSGAREWILLEGGCIVSAEFLQIGPKSREDETNGSKTQRSIDNAGQWLEGKLMGGNLWTGPSPTASPSSVNNLSDISLRSKKYGKYCHEAATIFDILDLDRDGLISYQELVESLICHPSIAKKLGVMGAEDRQAEIDNLFDLKYGVERHLPADTIDRITFVAYFSPNDAREDSLNQSISPIPTQLANLQIDQAHILSSRDAIQYLMSPRTTSIQSAVAPKILETSNVTWKNESALDCWLSFPSAIPDTAKSSSPGTSTASQSTTPFAITPLSTDSKRVESDTARISAFDKDSNEPNSIWPNGHVMPSKGETLRLDLPRDKSDVIDARPKPQQAFKKTRDSSISERRYHFCAETIVEALEGQDNIILETFLLIPPETTDEIINRSISWPVAKNSFLMEL